MDTKPFYNKRISFSTFAALKENGLVLPRLPKLEPAVRFLAVSFFFFFFFFFDFGAAGRQEVTFPPQQQQAR